jgi:8-oxo-dGTP pyrophosphatase MutT (NUDIX family)
VSASFVFAYHPKTGTYFAQLRSGRVKNPGRWCIPGGKWNPGETPEKAAHREFIEEVGVTPGKLLRVGHSQPKQRAVYLWITDEQFLPDLQASCADESADFRWVPLYDLPKPVAKWFLPMYAAAVLAIETKDW